MEAQEVQFQIEPSISALNNMSINYGEEEFVLLLTSGNYIKRYYLTPKHAKRVSLLLQQEIKNYEDKYGGLDTVLSISGKHQESQGIGFRS